MRKATVVANMGRAEALFVRAQKAKNAEVLALAEAAYAAGQQVLDAQAHFRAAMEAAGLSISGAGAEGEEPETSEAGEEDAAEEPADEAEGEAEETEAAEVKEVGEAETAAPLPSKQEMQRMYPPRLTDAQIAQRNRDRIEKLQKQEHEDALRVREATARAAEERRMGRTA